MPYKKFHLYLEEGENFNIEKTIRIYKKFHTELTGITYPNFNHYFKQGDPHRRITLRGNMTDEVFGEATTLMESLRETNEIHHFTSDETNIDNYVKSAHEFASKCTQIFNDNRDSFIPEINRDALWFIMNFIKLSFEKIGYDFYITWDIERHYLGEENSEHRTRLMILVDACHEYFNSNKELFKNPDFIERFIHLFFNCMLLSNFEKDFWKHLSRIKTIEKISNDYKV